MNRRNFISTSALGAALSATQSSPAATGDYQPKKAVMKLGCQSAPATDQRLQFFKRHSVNNISIDSPRPEAEGPGYPSVEELSALRERAEKHGVAVDMFTPSFLASSHIDNTRRPAIMLGQSPERDRDIDDVQKMIQNCAKVGIPSIKYNMSILGVVRLPTRTPGRGGSSYSTWRFKDAKPRTPLTKAGLVTPDIYWERITYFLDKVIPVATEYKVRMACHPHDPGMPPEGYQGVNTVLGTVDGLKKFVGIQESPYHGLNFCQGTVSEMLQDPGKEILDVIRYFGSRKKIFNVHFRNIRGKRDDFMEVYHDEGDINFVKAMMVYKEVGYPYMMMPDHVPQHPDDPHGDQAFAFAYGYIRGLIQMAQNLG
jgi:mannonate dehydratase